MKLDNEMVVLTAEIYFANDSLISLVKLNKDEYVIKSMMLPMET